MPTEEFNYHLIDPMIDVSFKNEAGTIDQPGSPMVDSIKDCLLDAGWTLEEELYPAGVMFVYGLFLTADPTVTVPPEDRVPAPADWVIRVGANSTPGSGTWIGIYNPFTELPPLMAHFFAKGVDVPDAASNIAAALSDTGMVTASSYVESGSSYVAITADIPGTSKNNFYISGDYRGAAMTSPILNNGGYKLRSGVYRGTQVELTVTEGPQGGDRSLFGRVNCEFEVVGTSHKVWQPLTTYQAGDTGTQHHYKLRMIAVPYQFAIFHDGPETSGSGGCTSLLCSIPWRPDDDSIGEDFCAIVIGSYQQSHALPIGSLRSSLFYNICFAALRGAFMELADQAIGMAMTRYPEMSLLTTSRKAIAQTSYVGVRPQGAPVDGQRIVGTFWSAAMLTEKYSTAGAPEAMIGDQNWRLVGSQSGEYNKTRGSLWLAIP